MKLYHACAIDDLDSILSEGLRAGSYLTGNEGIADYYVETIEDEEKDACILEIDLDDLIAAVGEAAIGVDRPSVAEPLCHTLGVTEGEVADAWRKCAGTWRDSLEIVGSVQVSVPIPPALLSRQTDDEVFISSP